MKILHLISDNKFIDSHIDRFKSSEFENTFVYLKGNNTYKGKYKDCIKHIRPNSDEYYKIIEHIKSFDIIFTNGLGYQQSVFINKLPKNCPKIFWCFFGAEIYNNPKIWKQKSLFAPETLKANQKNKGYKLFQKIYHLRFLFKGGKNIHGEIKKAILKSNYFVWYIKEEYDLIQENTTIKLPEFRYLPIGSSITNIERQYSKKNKILLGNSGSESSNHLDALQIFKEIGSEYEISLPFSYGVKKWYRKEIVSFINANQELKIKLIEDFVPYDQYILNFEEAKSAVYPSFRQMGLGNVVMCIRSGVKIYLSEKNPIYEWFKNNELLVYSIESDLRNDILTDNLQLNQDEIVKNKVNWNKLGNKQNKEQFAEMIKGSIK